MKTLLLLSALTVTLLASAFAHTTPVLPNTTVQTTEVSLEGEWKLYNLNGMEMTGDLTFGKGKTIKLVLAGNVIRDGIYTHEGDVLTVTEKDQVKVFKILTLTENELVLEDELGVSKFKR